MMLDTLITNATIVNADGRTDAHLGVAGGIITAMYGLGVVDLPDARRTIDAAGKLLIPGGVDGHCHVEQVTGAYKSLDTFATTTVSALHGGTTTIIDFAIPADSTESPQDAFENKLRLIDGARCSVSLHGSVINWDETVPAQLESLFEQGLRSVKLYTTNRGTTMADDDTILKVMKVMARLGGLTYIHAEHDAIIVDRTDSSVAAGRHSVRYLPKTRPPISEEASVKEMLAVAEYVGASIYFVHQSTPEAVDAVREARAGGQVAFSETCPHYLLLDDSIYASGSPERFACCPPFRPVDQVQGLLNRAAYGQIDVISSDNCCYDLAQKRQNRDDVRRMPHGLPGVETRMAASYTALVEGRGLSIERFVDMFATSAARINGLPSKGVVDIGYDADFVLFDPKESRVVDSALLHQGSDFSPFDGMTLYGWPHTVVSAGRVVIEDGVFYDPGPVGAYLPREGNLGTSTTGLADIMLPNQASTEPSALS